MCKKCFLAVSSLDVCVCVCVEGEGKRADIKLRQIIFCYIFKFLSGDGK